MAWSWTPSGSSAILAARWRVWIQAPLGFSSGVPLYLTGGTMAAWLAAARRSWPFARMETTKPLRVEEVELPPGNYALVFHPNTPDDAGMSLEVRQIAPGEFLQAGNVMTRTPEGETLWKAPVAFDTADTTAPSLTIRLLPAAAGFTAGGGPGEPGRVCGLRRRRARARAAA